MCLTKNKEREQTGKFWKGKKGKSMAEKKKPGASILKWIKKHKKLLIVMVLLLIGVGVIRKKLQEQQEKMAALLQNQIKTATVEKRSIISYISTTGKVESIESRDITSSLTGYDVAQVYVEVGDLVQEGDVLLSFDTTDILEDISDVYTDISNTNRQNQIAVEQAQRNYDAAQISNEEQADSMNDTIADAKKKLDEALEDKLVYEKQRMADEAYVTAALNAWNEVKGDYEAMKLEYENLTAEVTRTQTELADAKSVLNMAQMDLDDYKRDNEEDFDEVTGKILDEASRAAFRKDEAVKDAQESVNYFQSEYEKASMRLNELKDEYADATTIYNQLQADYEAAVSAWTASENQLDSQRDLIETLEDTYEDALENQVTQERNNTNSLLTSEDQIELQQLSGTNSIKALQDKLSAYQKNLKKTEVKAPFSGTITDVRVDPGDTYATGALITLQDCSELIVVTEVDEYDISTIKNGMRAVIKTDATREEEMEGTVSFIAPTPTQGGTSVTYRVEITLNKQEERLRLGMTAKTNLVMEEKENVLTVPYDAILSDPEGKNYITLMEPAEEGITNRRDVYVTVGTEGDYYVEISSEEELEGKEVLLPDAGGNALEDMMSLMMGE